MSNFLVKFIKNDDGDDTDGDWHLVDPANVEGAAKLCTREFFGDGESAVVYEEKEVLRGGITCRKCLNNLQLYKSVKL